MSLPAGDPIAALNRVIKHTTVNYLDRPRAVPFVKWAGGKRSLVSEIVKVLPEQFGNTGSRSLVGEPYSLRLAAAFQRRTCRIATSN